MQLTHRCCNQTKSNRSNEWAKRKAAGRPTVKAAAMPFKTIGI